MQNLHFADVMGKIPAGFGKIPATRGHPSMQGMSPSSGHCLGWCVRECRVGTVVAGLFPRAAGRACVWQWLSALGGISPR